MQSIQDFPAYWEIRTLLARAYPGAQRARQVFEQARAGDPGDVLFEGVGANQLWDGILRAAWSAGRLGNLLQFALADRSIAVLHPSLRKQRARLPVDLSTAELDANQTQGLEAFVGGNRAFLDVAAWRQELARRERQVCHVRCGNSEGSGFLVAPAIVLTCCHVLQPLLDGNTNSAVFTFDYKRLEAGGEVTGASVPLAQSDSIIDQSPVGELDFMVVRLAREGNGPPLEQPNEAASETKRGFWALPNGNAQVRPGLACLQHPLGQPLKLALDPAAVPVRDGNYFRYAIPTQPGSSGAPVFDNDYRLVALHRFGIEGAHNSGVAIDAIAGRRALAGYVAQ